MWRSATPRLQSAIGALSPEVIAIPRLRPEPFLANLPWPPSRHPWSSMDKEFQALIDAALSQPHFDPPGRDGVARPQQEAAEVSLAPHRGCVAVDMLDDRRCVITHLVTNEKLALQGAHMLEFDDDGFGAAVPSQAGAPIVVLEEAFRFAYYLSADGERYLSFSDQSERAALIKLSEIQAKCSSVNVQLFVGPSQAPKTLQAVCYKWPRAPAARVMFCTKSLYNELGLSQFGGESWRWIHGSWKRWQAMLRAEFGLAEHVVPSSSMKERRLHPIPSSRLCVRTQSLVRAS